MEGYEHNRLASKISNTPVCKYKVVNNRNLTPETHVTHASHQRPFGTDLGATARCDPELYL